MWLCSFYGFPDHYYKEKYPNVGSKEVSHKVLDALKEAGIEAKGVKRGLDHGVWASFKCGTSYIKTRSCTHANHDINAIQRSSPTRTH